MSDFTLSDIVRLCIDGIIQKLLWNAECRLGNFRGSGILTSKKVPRDDLMLGGSFELINPMRGFTE
ncbi:hypothetical protein DPV78_010978 [Talaromyces pinophilus]|nr:hypothetical protein DPV78_010978 [Talaromyces pinophilus]